MRRKRLTEIFPFLLPLRRKQRIFCVHLKMLLDKNKYSKTIIGKKLDNLIFSEKTTLINPNTGMDIIYQYNKVHNLKLASKTMNGLIIKPGEIYSFNFLVKNAEKHGKYKDGLIDMDDKLVADKGGGICQLSNILFWVFLHGDLKIIERHGHGKMDFPYPEDGVPEGTDATVSEGWLDLQVKNETDKTYQIIIDFDDQCMQVSLYCDVESENDIKVIAKDGYYFRRGEGVYRRCSLVKQDYKKETGELVKEVHLYDNECEIGYEVNYEEIREEM